jgi:aarF domain-containing kinase
MPKSQLMKQLTFVRKLEREKFESFEERSLLLRPSDTFTMRPSTIKRPEKFFPVVVKMQYPGVAQSIESDLGNLAMLVKMTGIVPKGLFIENVIRVGRDELKVECNYWNELANQVSFQALVEADPVLCDNRFVVPDVWENLTSEQVLTTSYARGETIDNVANLGQDERNRIGRTILYLTMQE